MDETKIQQQTTRQTARSRVVKLARKAEVVQFCSFGKPDCGERVHPKWLQAGNFGASSYKPPGFLAHRQSTSVGMWDKTATRQVLLPAVLTIRFSRHLFSKSGHITNPLNQKALATMSTYPSPTAMTTVFVSSFLSSSKNPSQPLHTQPTEPMTFPTTKLVALGSAHL